MSTYLRYLLLPFSLCYGLVTMVRNKLFDLGIFKSVKFDLPVICVGNLVVGGSGKTPVTEYLVNLLPGKRIAILSRGYGRETKGFLLADAASTAKSIGDEPLQYFHKFNNVTVAVCENRTTGINRLKDDHDVILLDDAFQHRKVKAGLYILLFDYGAFFKPQFLLPAGNLRESFNGFKRADLIVITKSPEPIEPGNRNAIRNRFGNILHPEVFFSQIKYDTLKPVFDNAHLPAALKSGPRIYLLTGIANPKPLLTFLEQQEVEVVHHKFPDHYQFKIADISKLVADFNADAAADKLIITTEKDAQRLFDAPIKELLLNLPIFYLPIQVVITEEGRQTFDQKILNYVSSTTRDR